jgi:hypothetical protein
MGPRGALLLRLRFDNEVDQFEQRFSRPGSGGATQANIAGSRPIPGRPTLQRSQAALLIAHLFHLSLACPFEPARVNDAPHGQTGWHDERDDTTITKVNAAGAFTAPLK